MSGSRRSRRSDVWRAPMRPPKGVAITTAPPSDDRLMKKTNIPNIVDLPPVMILILLLLLMMMILKVIDTVKQPIFNMNKYRLNVIL